DRDPRDGGAAIDGAKLVRERRLNNAKRNWALFRSDAPAVVGALVLLFFVVIALAAPLIAPATMLDVTQQLEAPRYAPPSLDHPLGTDGLGRELWVRILWGARVSILVGVAATVMSMVIGTIMGLAAEQSAEVAAGIIMRIIHFFIVLPPRLLSIVLSSGLDRGVFTLVIAIGLTSSASPARIARPQSLSVESRLYIERARILGVGHRHILFRHLLPAVMP